MCEPLQLEDVWRLVEEASPALQMSMDGGESGGTGGDGGKGRYLVARRPIRAGEVVLAEWPLFYGNTAGMMGRQAFREPFASQVSDPDWEAKLQYDEDCLHPRSPLVDCIGGIFLAKHRAFSDVAEGDAEAREQREDATHRLRKFASLCRAAIPEAVPEDVVADILSVLRPDLQTLTSLEEIRDFVHILTSNRFGSADAQLDVMFAGSMFEHSCEANCFVAGVWRAPMTDRPREYRALRDIEAGEALSIDYVLVPGTYLGAAGRAELLSGWGFVCSCARCTERPELTRSFLCPSCELPELCPRRPARAGEAQELCCLACGKVPPEASVGCACLCV